MLNRVTIHQNAIDTSRQEMPDYLRAQGRLRLSFAKGMKTTHVAELAESGGFRIKFPKTTNETAEAIIVNTAGGMTGGDTLMLEVEMAQGASALVTTQAAEKIYKSIAGDTSISARLTLGPGADLVWAPQETILYDNSRLNRRLEAEIEPTATALICESLVFGRLAHGESLTNCALHDRWRIRRGGRLIFADDVRLEGNVAAMLDRPAIAAGGRAIATVLLVAPHAENRLEAARSILENADCQCAASAMPGIIIARFLASDPGHLRSALTGYLTGFAGMVTPRSWQC